MLYYNSISCQFECNKHFSMQKRGRRTWLKDQREVKISVQKLENQFSAQTFLLATIYATQTHTTCKFCLFCVLRWVKMFRNKKSKTSLNFDDCTMPTVKYVTDSWINNFHFLKNYDVDKLTDQRHRRYSIFGAPNSH